MYFDPVHMLTQLQNAISGTSWHLLRHASAYSAAVLMNNLYFPSLTHPTMLP